ncbi:hypothetical protein D3C75_1158490 [compost metagenome]
MSDERLQQRMAARKRLDALLSFEQRGVSDSGVQAEIEELSAFLRTREIHG